MFSYLGHLPKKLLKRFAGLTFHWIAFSTKKIKGNGPVHAYQTTFLTSDTYPTAHRLDSAYGAMSSRPWDPPSTGMEIWWWERSGVVAFTAVAINIATVSLLLNIQMHGEPYRPDAIAPCAGSRWHSGSCHSWIWHMGLGICMFLCCIQI